jgi:hypothetical protein
MNWGHLDGWTPAPVAIEIIQSPESLTAAAKAIAEVAQGISVKDEFMFLVKYGQAVRQKNLIRNQPPLT